MRRPTKPARVAVAILIVGLVGSGSPASAVTHVDPRGDARVDIWTASKTKVVVDDGPSRHRFKVYAFLNTDWVVMIYLDTHGGTRADYRLANNKFISGLGGCNMRRLSDDMRIKIRCGDHVVRDEATFTYTGRLTWSIPRPRLQQTKRIRWRVHAHHAVRPQPRHDDDAPDEGWYR